MDFKIKTLDLLDERARAQDQKVMGKSRRKKRDKQVTSCEMKQGPTEDSRTASSQQNNCKCNCFVDLSTA